MNKTRENAIGFRIHHIETLQFAILEEKIKENNLSFSASFGFAIDTEGMLVRSSFKYEFRSEDSTALIIEVAIDFAVEKKSFEKQIFKNKVGTLPKNLANHLAMIVVGTARGILFEKTKGTPLGAFPMPTINVTESITDDVEFE